MAQIREINDRTKDALDASIATKTVITAREADTVDQLMTEMTTRRFRHMPVVERGQLVGLVSIGDLVKIHVADAEFEVRARCGSTSRHSLARLLTNHPD